MPGIALKQVDFFETPTGYEIVNGGPQEIQGLYTPIVDYEDIEKRIEEGNDTYEVITGPSGRKYEKIEFNRDKAGVATIIKPSTSFSSGYKNPADVLETVLTAAANPGARYVYLTSFGNYPTGLMAQVDLNHLAKNGRYTTGNGVHKPYRPVSSVMDMAEMLINHELTPTHFSADEEGGRLALALMAALEPNTIQGTFLNGTNGISPKEHYIWAQLSENISSRLHRRTVKDSQPGELTPVNIKDLKRKMPNIYRGLGRIAHIAPIPLILFPKDDWSKFRLMQGFHGHNDQRNLNNHAVFHDLRAALFQQETTVTMQFNAKSKMHDIEKCISFGKIVMDSLPQELRTEKRRIRLLLGEGGLDQHAEKPHERTRIERLALSDIAQQMTELFGSLTDSQVFELKPIEQAA